jgi:hypothetical protein
MAWISLLFGRAIAFAIAVLAYGLASVQSICHVLRPLAARARAASARIRGEAG